MYVDKKTLVLAREIKEGVLEHANALKQVSVFLCGAGDGDNKALRDKLGYILANKKSKYNYSVYYPENLFFDLIRGHEKHNLLNLENLLAETVTSTVILVHSPGTLAELGAFSNHPSLSNKLVVVIDSKYEKDKSFINLGPVQHLRQNTKSKVIYNNFANIEELAGLIAPEIRKMKSDDPSKLTLINPICSLQFINLLIYIFGPIPRVAFDKIIESIETPENYKKIRVFADSAVTSLINEGVVISANGNLSTENHLLFEDDFSLSYFFRYVKNISKMRSRAVNITLRKDRGWRV